MYIDINETNDDQIKINYYNKIKLIEAPKSFEQLVNFILKAYEIKLSTRGYINLSYFDDESDKIIVTNDMDYKSAINYSKNMILNKGTVLRLDIEMVDDERNSFEQREISLDPQSIIEGGDILTTNRKNSLFMDSSEFISKDEKLIYIEENNDIRKIVKLKNNGQNNWSKYYTLVCLNGKDKNQYLSGPAIQTKVIIKPNDILNLEIVIPKAKILPGKYTSIWQMRNDTNDFFGVQFELDIIVLKKNEKPSDFNDININENYDINNINNYPNNENDEYEELKKKYQTEFENFRGMFDIRQITDDTIYNALKFAEGNESDTYDFLNKLLEKK
jgi:hypothetical protein